MFFTKTHIWFFVAVPLGIIIFLFVVLTIYLRQGENLNNLINPHQFESMTLYDVDAFENQNFDKIELSKISHVVLERELTQKIFSDIVYHKGTILWKGNYLGIVEVSDGTEKHVAISFYGGFFKILRESGYYEIKGDSRKLFDKKLKDILTNIFIPGRQTK